MISRYQYFMINKEYSIIVYEKTYNSLWFTYLVSAHVIKNNVGIVTNINYQSFRNKTENFMIGINLMDLGFDDDSGYYNCIRTNDNTVYDKLTSKFKQYFCSGKCRL